MRALPSSLAVTIHRSFAHDTALTAMFDAQRAEFDTNKRYEILKNIQKHLALKMYHVPDAGYGALGFSLAQVWEGNFNVFASYDNAGIGTAGPVPYTWYDDSKK